MRRKCKQVPVRIDYAKNNLLFQVHWLVQIEKANTQERDLYIHLMEEGIRKSWGPSLELTEELYLAFCELLQKRAPQSLAEFKKDVRRKRTEEIRRKQERAYRLLNSALRQLKSKRQVRHLPPVHFNNISVRLGVRFIFTKESFAGKYPLWRFFRRCIEGARRPLLIYIKSMRIAPAHVKSSIFRRVWGFFRDGKIISIGFNWHPLYPGLIFLPANRSAAYFKKVAAHEFGHAMGLSDAYSAWYRAYDEHAGSENYLMNSNGHIQGEEWLLLCKAQSRGKLSHFPYRFKRKRFCQGLKKELRYYMKKIFQK